MVDLTTIHHVDEFEAIATSVLPESIADYVAGGAGHEKSVARNRDALDELMLVPRVLRDVTEVSTSTSILDTTTRHPIILAPSAVQRLADDRGELATARAACAAGITMVLSMNSTTPVEDVAATGVYFWMQLYVSSDRGHLREIIDRAAATGAGALCITVDSAGMPARVRELHRPLEIPSHLELVHHVGSSDPYGVDRSLSWSDLAWFREVSELPLILKGVLHPDDARKAADLGVDALVISNHGGRQVDGVASAWDVLEPIVESVGDELEVFADGGIRSGPDVLKALALGARACLVGRPVWWSLAAAGEAGVARMIELLAGDLEEAMRLCGQTDVRKIEANILMRT